MSFEEYLRDIRKAAVARLTPAERTALGELLTEKPRKDPYAALKARPVVKEWKVGDLLAAADAKTAKRDVENGRRVFAEALCFGCHRFDGRGGMTGPDLTGVAGRYDTRTLLESLLEPSKVVSDRYAAVRIATLDGRVLTGTVKDLTGDEWTVMTDPLDPAGLVKVRRKDVESVRPSPVSPMPTGLLNTFTEAEVLDLIAFLRAGGPPRGGDPRPAPASAIRPYTSTSFAGAAVDVGPATLHTAGIRRPASSRWPDAVPILEAGHVADLLDPPHLFEPIVRRRTDE